MQARLQEIRDKMVACYYEREVSCDINYLLDALHQAQAENTNVLQGLNYERNMVNELLEAVRWQEAQISVMSAVMSGGQGNSTNIKLVKNKKNQELAVIAQELQQYRDKATKLESSRDQWQADYNVKNAECMALERAYEKLEDRERVLREALESIVQAVIIESHPYKGLNIIYEIAREALGQESNSIDSSFNQLLRKKFNKVL